MVAQVFGETIEKEDKQLVLCRENQEAKVFTNEGCLNHSWNTELDCLCAVVCICEAIQEDSRRTAGKKEGSRRSFGHFGTLESISGCWLGNET